VRAIKIATSFLAAVLFVGALGAINTAMAADGIIYKQELTPGSYCHLKLPAIDEDTLGTKHPVLKDPSSGDIIDSYGPCDENPVGKHQVEEQELEELHQWFRE
jgi:hypothetical protein